MDYAIAHAFLGVTFVVHMPTKGTQPKVISLKDDAGKEEFVLKTLQRGDLVLIENGGAGDKLVELVLARGIEVHRIPTFELGNKDRCQDTVTAQDWKIKEEKSTGGETGDKLTSRKVRAMAVMAAWQQRPELFTQSTTTDQTMLQIKHLFRAYRMSQKVLLATYLRLVSTFKDRYLLELARLKADDEDFVVDKARVDAHAVMQAMNAMLVVIPEDEREQFMAKLGLDKIKERDVIPRKQIDSMFRTIIDALMESDVISPFMVNMKDTLDEIKKLLKTLPVYKLVFEPLQGCGPLIAARMISTIVDIRRFENDAKLKAYAGYHHFEDGSRARRRAGQVSNWQTELKQAVYLWTQQTIKLKSSPWRAKLDLRRAFELYKILRVRQVEADKMGIEVKLLPDAFDGREISSVLHMTPADLGILDAHVEILRKRAGVQYMADSSAPKEAATNPEIGKFVRGIKGNALDKAVRWLGQQVLKHIFKEWRKAIGIHNLPRISPETEENDDASSVEVRALPKADVTDRRPQPAAGL
ncbi:MAG: transposase [Patescibacteria group bacterium]